MEKKSKTTNENPVQIPLEFQEALSALLKVKPQKETKKTKKKPPKPKNKSTK